jgi:pimeloyl-ACP methyl ester carboxylesterase
VTRDVVLVPGLWMPGAAMALLAARLGRAGYAPRLFAYRGRRSFQANRERFARFAQETLDGQAAHYIGHSLGGVLVFDMLNCHPEIPVASAVLLGAPVRGCLAGRRFGGGRLGRWMMGACGERWQEREAAWKRDAPLGVVAGTVPLGLGRTFGGRLPGANDGVVCVEETAVAGMTARALVPAGHSLLIVSGAVERLVERFLNTGRFQ